MVKLKIITQQLNEAIYDQVESVLKKNKAGNFLFLLQSYRKSTLKDEEIMRSLNISANSFGVLKSRLFDKIQDYLSGDIYSSKEEVLILLHQIPEKCYTNSREVATAFLLKLEKDLLHFDMHHELLVVYSALKKIHLYSEKYYYYSQLFNKHIAFSLSLEKSEEILGNFMRTLCEYNFSRSAKTFETLFFLRKEINDHYHLNNSRQVEIIKNIIEIQLNLFCGADKNNEDSTEEMLFATEKTIEDLPASFFGKSWTTALDFLFFEHYKKTGRVKLSTLYYEKVNINLRNLLLFSNICISPKFLISKIAFLQEQGRAKTLAAEYDYELLIDRNDQHAIVLYGLYQAMILYYKNDFKTMAGKLNEIINDHSFKDLYHINLEIRLSLVYNYLIMGEFELADNILKNISRKIKAEELKQYEHVLNLIKVFNDDIKQKNKKITLKQKNNFALFMARNGEGSNEVLSHLVRELKNKYS